MSCSYSKYLEKMRKNGIVIHNLSTKQIHRIPKNSDISIQGNLFKVQTEDLHFVGAEWKSIGTNGGAKAKIYMYFKELMHL